MKVSIVRLKNYALSILLTFIISIFLLSMFSLLITYVDVSSSVRNIALSAISILSAFLSGFFASRKRSHRGYLTGSIASVLYWSFVFILAVFLGYAPFSFSRIFKILLQAIPFGMLGGIMGINSK